MVVHQYTSTHTSMDHPQVKRFFTNRVGQDVQDYIAKMIQTSYNIEKTIAILQRQIDNYISKLYRIQQGPPAFSRITPEMVIQRAQNLETQIFGRPFTKLGWTGNDWDTRRERAVEYHRFLETLKKKNGYVINVINYLRKNKNSNLKDFFISTFSNNSRKKNKKL